MRIAYVLLEELPSVHEEDLAFSLLGLDLLSLSAYALPLERCQRLAPWFLLLEVAAGREHALLRVFVPLLSVLLLLYHYSIHL